jgi:hypothetical protein
MYLNYFGLLYQSYLKAMGIWIGDDIDKIIISGVCSTMTGFLITLANWKKRLVLKKYRRRQVGVLG